MKLRALGATGMTVSELGLGAGPLGGLSIDDAGAVALIRGAIDLGISLIDTAPSYGRSEVRIGAALRGCRHRVVLSTKLGYGVPGVADWTGPCITAGIDLALERLGTSWLDIAHLHSCPVDVLARGDVIEALAAAVRAGKVRVPAYSGDGDALAWAIDSGLFGVIQCSVNVADQRALDGALMRASAAGIGVLAKRPLANGVWEHRERPKAPDQATYWERLRVMMLPPADADPAAYALGFALAQPGVSAVLVGTTRPEHLERAASAAAAGPLETAAVEHARATFHQHDRRWDGIV